MLFARLASLYRKPSLSISFTPSYRSRFLPSTGFVFSTISLFLANANNQGFFFTYYESLDSLFSSIWISSRIHSERHFFVSSFIPFFILWFKNVVWTPKVYELCKIVSILVQIRTFIWRLFEMIRRRTLRTTFDCVVGSYRREIVDGRRSLRVGERGGGGRWNENVRSLVRVRTVRYLVPGSRTCSYWQADHRTDSARFGSAGRPLYPSCESPIFVPGLVLFENRLKLSLVYFFVFALFLMRLKEILTFSYLKKLICPRRLIWNASLNDIIRFNYTIHTIEFVLIIGQLITID